MWKATLCHVMSVVRSTIYSFKRSFKCNIVGYEDGMMMWR